MKRSGLVWPWRFLWLALLVFCLVTPLSAQEDEEFVPEDDSVAEEEGEFVPEGDEEEALSLTAGRTDFSLIQDILAIDEEVMSDPGIYNYDPGARRDPFISLAERRRESGIDTSEADRPEGPAGLLIDEIAVEGVFILPDGPVVQIQSAGQETSFLLRPGDQLWDGDVVSITLDRVVFKQTVDDPTALKPFREVVKLLEP